MSLTQKTKQRRRDILKAAVGAPVIFTLPTGSALAAVSLTCKDKSQVLASQNPPKGVVAASDTWMRFKVTGKKVKILNNNNVLKGFTLNGKWYRVYVGNGVNSGRVEDITLTRNVNYSPNPLENGEFYYLLVDHTDQQNQPGSPESFVFLGTTDPNFAPIAGHTCWNSISTVGPKNLTGNVIN